MWEHVFQIISLGRFFSTYYLEGEGDVEATSKLDFTYLWLAGNEGMDKKAETIIMLLELHTDYDEDPCVHFLLVRGKLRRLCALSESRLDAPFAISKWVDALKHAERGFYLGCIGIMEKKNANYSNGLYDKVIWGRLMFRV